jgi:hypothetical protein
MRDCIRRLYPWQEGSHVQECDAMRDYDEEDSIAKQAYEDVHGVSLQELETERMCSEDTQRAAAEKEAGFQEMLRGVNHFWFWKRWRWSTTLSKSSSSSTTSSSSLRRERGSGAYRGMTATDCDEHR